MRAARRDEIDKIETVDALVHAAGIMRGGRLGELDHDAGDLLWRIHVDAAIRLADHFAPRLSDGGRIVLIGSRAAQGVAAKSQYGAAKAALTALARAWAQELIDRGITVNVVAPAATETAMMVDPDRAIVAAGNAAARPPDQAGRSRRPGFLPALRGRGCDHRTRNIHLRRRFALALPPATACTRHHDHPHPRYRRSHQADRLADPQRLHRFQQDDDEPGRGRHQRRARRQAASSATASTPTAATARAG